MTRLQPKFPFIAVIAMALLHVPTSMAASPPTATGCSTSPGKKKSACADVYTDWLHQADRGIAPFSQLHNWINHPGNQSHGVYAETILRLFSVDPSKTETSSVGKEDACVAGCHFLSPLGNSHSGQLPGKDCIYALPAP